MNVKAINLGIAENSIHFSNYKACQSCKDKKQCCKNSTHRTITRYSNDFT